eukprot:COSAG01_NODE_942_length_12551_cov_47.129216_3_plen_192_part_00
MRPTEAGRQIGARCLRARCGGRTPSLGRAGERPVSVIGHKSPLLAMFPVSRLFLSGNIESGSGAPGSGRSVAPASSRCARKAPNARPRQPRTPRRPRACASAPGPPPAWRSGRTWKSSTSSRCPRSRQGLTCSRCVSIARKAVYAWVVFLILWRIVSGDGTRRRRTRCVLPQSSCRLYRLAAVVAPGLVRC